MSVSVQWLLNEELAEGFSLLAGHLDDSVNITGVNIMDNPNTLPWLAPGTLVLSTGYLFNEGKLDKDIIRQLKERECACLGLKMNRYLKELPPYILSQAEEYNFPIVSVPYSASFVEINKLVYRKIYEEEMTEAQRQILAYNDISESLIVNQNLSKAVSILQKFTNSDIFLTNDAFETIEYSLLDNQIFPYPFSKNPYTVFSDNDTNTLSQEMQQNHSPVYNHIIEYNGIKYDFNIFPLINRNSILGHLIIRKNDLTNKSALEMLLNIKVSFCLALLNKVVLTETERSSRDIFFHNLLSGTLQNEQELERLCIQNAFPSQNKSICFLIKIPEYEQLSLSKRRAYERKLFSLIDQLNEDPQLTIFHTVFQTNFVLFYFPNELPTQNNYSIDAAAYAQKLFSYLKKNHINGKISYSKCKKGASTIFLNYQQTIKELEIGQKLHPNTNIFSYHDDEMYQHLLEHFSMRQLRSFYHETLGPLEKYDNANNTELLKTLKTYIETNSNMAQTSNILFLHRNTCSYRLKQIEELLSIQLSDINTLFRLKTALIIQEIMEIL